MMLVAIKEILGAVFLFSLRWFVKSLMLQKEDFGGVLKDWRFARGDISCV